jgi:predicted dehydrogenase
MTSTLTAPAPAAAASGQDTLRIGIVGAGGRGINCFGDLLARRSDVELVALADSNHSRMENAAAYLEREMHLYTSAAAMYESERLDGAIVTLPDYLHADFVVEALHSGVPNVLVDKPLATTSEGCRRVAQAAQKTGGRVTMGFNLRHLPTLRKIKELIGEGAIGELMLIENREFYDGGRTYMGRWNRKYEWSGGLWIHKGSHDFDIFNWWNAAGTPQRVAAAAGLNALRPDKIPFEVEPDKAVGPYCAVCAYKEICPDVSPLGSTNIFNEQTEAEDGYVKDLCIFLSDKDVHDNGIALVEYDNNVRASHLECFVCGFDDRLYTIVGDRGTLMANLANPTQIELRPRWGETQIIEVPPAAEGSHGGADPLLVEDWIESMTGGGAASASIRDGIRSVAIGEAAELAWREKRSVEIKELVDLYDPLLG